MTNLFTDMKKVHFKFSSVGGDTNRGSAPWSRSLTGSPPPTVSLPMRQFEISLVKKGANLLVAILLLLVTPATFAQQPGDNLVSGNFHEATFSDFVQKIEAQTNYHFFY